MKRSLISDWRAAAAVVLAGAAFLGATGAANAAALRDKWCSKVHLRFFVGGAEGDAFGTIVYNGARQAAADTGAQVDYVFSGWANEKMTQQLREAVAAHPDGIAMMGHPGEAAIVPLAQEAAKHGIKMMYQNVPVPAAVDKVGGGYVGAQQAPQGHALGVEILRRFGLKSGDLAIVILASNDVIRNAREEGTAKAIEEGGVKVVRLSSEPEWAADPNLAIPVVTAAFQANPTAKAIVYPGGQQLGNAATYMKAAGKKPGEIINIGFDTSPQIVEAFKRRLGAVDSRPTAIPARLSADSEPLRADRVRSCADQRRHGRGLCDARKLQGGCRSGDRGTAREPTGALPAVAARSRRFPSRVALKLPQCPNASSN